MNVGREAAEALALRALAWIASADDRIGGFLGASGLSPDTLRQRAADPDMLLAVLDFLISDDAMILDFCRETGSSPAEPMAARSVLQGRGGMHWT